MIYRAPGNATVVESRGLLRVQYTRQGFLNISLSTLFYNVTCGLCGVFNSNATDDLRLPNGRQAESTEQFADGWRSIADDLTCNGDCDALYQMCTDLRLYQNPWMCGNINDPGNSSFLACHAVVNPSPFFRNCLYNMCVKEGNRSALCSSLQAYATACQDAQVGLASWRSVTNCREFIGLHFKAPDSHFDSLLRVRIKYHLFLSFLTFRFLSLLHTQIHKYIPILSYLISSLTTYSVAPPFWKAQKYFFVKTVDSVHLLLRKAAI